MNSGCVLDYPSCGKHILDSIYSYDLQVWKFVILATGQQKLGIQMEGPLAPCVHTVGLEGQTSQLCSQELRLQVFAHQKPVITFFLFSQQEF